MAVTRPNSSRTMRPYPVGSGSSTVSRTRSCPEASSCIAAIVSRERSGTSPRHTSVFGSEGSRLSKATLRACPVPSCGSCSAKVTSSRPPKRALTSSARCPTTTTRGDEEKPDVASSTCSSMGRPASGCSTFGNTECMRFPMPAARITMFMNSSENTLATAPIGGRGIRSCVGRAFYQRASPHPSGLSVGSSLVTKGP